MKGIEDILTTAKGKDVDIRESMEEVDSQICDLERRKRYLEGRLYEVQSIQAAINEMGGDDAKGGVE